MAGGLSAFFAQNAVKQEHLKTVVSPRFLDEDGKPVQWEARALTSGEDEALRKRYTRMAPVAGKAGQYRQEFDTNGYLAALAAACTVFPDLNDAQLQDSYGVLGPEALLGAMLLPGENAGYMQQLQALNGFLPMAELEETAKN